MFVVLCVPSVNPSQAFVDNIGQIGCSRKSTIGIRASNNYEGDISSIKFMIYFIHFHIYNFKLNWLKETALDELALHFT